MYLDVCTYARDVVVSALAALRVRQGRSKSQHRAMLSQRLNCLRLLSLNVANTAMETEGVMALAATQHHSACMDEGALGVHKSSLLPASGVSQDGLLNSQMTRLRELDLSENGISEAEAVNCASLMYMGPGFLHVYCWFAGAGEPGQDHCRHNASNPQVEQKPTWQRRTVMFNMLHLKDIKLGTCSLL